MGSQPSKPSPDSFEASWHNRARAKRADTESKIPPEWRLGTDVLDSSRRVRSIAGPFIDSLTDPRTLEITSCEAHELTEKIRSKAYTALEVTTAFCNRAAIAHQLNNCLHEIFFEQAQARASELDRHLADTGRPVGPLHGLPISLKDQFHVPNVETTMGYVGWIGTFEGEKGTGKEKVAHSLVVSELLSLGAVLYCKTSLPQTLLLGETINNIIGRTMNPVSQNLSCGGSSGGEGAMLALRSSCLGIGTDIGGSVRIPAAFCGVCSLKPSVARISYQDVANSNPGQMTVSSAVGIMSTSLPSIRLLLKSLLSTEPWLLDPEVVELPWSTSKEELGDAQLCFGIMATDDVVCPHPPVVRAVNLAREAVEKAGHKTMTWQPPSHAAGAEIHGKFIYADGGHDIFRQTALSGEPLIPPMREELGEKPSPPIGYLQYQELCLKRKAYRAEYASYWMSTSSITGTGRPVDAIIIPTAPHAAVIPGKFFHYAYTEIFNLLDYTSVCIPVTRADKKIDVFDHAYQPTSDVDRLNWEAYDADEYDSAPVGLQIVGRALQDERVLSIAMKVQDALR